MNKEIIEFTNMLCAMVNNAVENVVLTHTDELPFFLFFAARKCFVLYDTEKEKITSISLYVIEKDHLTIEVDPIDGYVRGGLGDKVTGTVRMKKHVSNTLFACISKLWLMRLSEEGLITVNGNDGYIAADLLA